MPRTTRRSLSQRQSSTASSAQGKATLTVPKAAGLVLTAALIAFSGVMVFIGLSANSVITDLLAHNNRPREEFIQNRRASLQSQPETTPKTAAEKPVATTADGHKLFQKKYTRNRLPNGELKKELEWTFNTYSKEKPLKKDDTRKDKRKLLVVQYTGWEDYYYGMTAISSKANRAYAKVHQFDYVRLNGVAYGNHTGPEATYNKIHILKQLRTTYKNMSYDAALLLDSDAVIVDFDVNVLDLLPPKILLTAHKVWPKDPPHTHYVNAGVTLWNLNHPQLDKFVKTWERKILSKIRKGEGVSDQGKLYQTLREYGAKDRKRLGIVNGLNTTHFQPRNGTFVTHFIRAEFGLTHDWDKKAATYFEPREDRIKKIERAVEKACHSWPSACDGLDDDAE